ncbi:DEAD/DEAH box helicase [Massilia timonae]|uniref:DEAD/DEAH box helicase n=1 Tax=Massilia timonae TaxID=47229 RepID=UPI0028A7B00F|nr:DEAD/DEAH box helicase [Massilia timonae]
MNLLPSDIDFIKNATATSARERGLRPIYPTRITNDFTVALKCIGVYQTLETDVELEKLDEEEFAKPLIAAGRMLLALANNSDELSDENEANFMRLNGALAFAMQGNFPSAKAALREISEDFLLSSAIRSIAAAVCNPLIQIKFFDPDSTNHTSEIFHAYFLQSLKSGNRDLLNLAIESIGEQADFNNSEDTALLLSIEMSCRQAFRLATTHLHTNAPEIPDWFLNGAVDSGVLTLLPPQRNLLAKQKIASGISNSLLNLPTSTGKTFIAEACMAAAVRNGGVSFFIAPYISIGNQAFQSLQRKCNDSVEIISMFGGHYSKRIAPKKPTIVVATPERFDAWLRTQQDTCLLRLVVFDEIHYIENGARGIRLEGIISRLLLIQKRQPSLRLMGLSAVLPGAGVMSGWLQVPQTSFHFLSWRPTARRVAICQSNGVMSWLNGTDPLRPVDKEADEIFAHSVKLNLSTVSPSAHYPTKDAEKNSGNNVAKIALDLSKRLGGCGLIVCPRRADTRELASILANHREPADEHSPANILAFKMRLAYPWLQKLIHALERGVAYHNASLPYDVRRDIEDLVRNGDLIFVASTTTLAEGADLPFRWTLVSHWLQGLHPDGIPLKSLTFRNMAGRSGRAGYYTEGDTIVFHNTLGNKNAVGHTSQIPQKVKEVMFGVEPVTSAISHDESDQNKEISEPIKAACASQLLACIAENPNDDDIVSSLVSSTYSTASGNKEIILGVVKEALSQVLNDKEPGGPFAVRNSPIRLTEIGIAANRSGFSPKTCRTILQFLNEEDFPSSTPDLIAKVLLYFSLIPEQQDHYLRKVCTEPKQRSFLKSSDLSEVLRKNLGGHPIREIFEELPARIKSNASDDYIEKEFDKFSQATESVIPTFASWILRGISMMSSFSVWADTPQPDWINIARSWDNLRANQSPPDTLDDDI